MNEPNEVTSPSTDNTPLMISVAVLRNGKEPVTIRIPLGLIESGLSPFGLPKDLFVKLVNAKERLRNQPNTILEIQASPEETVRVTLS